MNQTHIHLLVNHIPVLGVFFGAALLLYGTIRKNTDTQLAAHVLLVIAALGAVVTYITGEPAEHTLQKFANASHHLIEEHEEAALYALITMCVSGLFAAIAAYLLVMKDRLAERLGKVVIALALFAFVIIARTAFLGGQIRHTETSNLSDKNFKEAAAPSSSEEEN